MWCPCSANRRIDDWKLRRKPKLLVEKRILTRRAHDKIDAGAAPHPLLGQEPVVCPALRVGAAPARDARPRSRARDRAAGKARVAAVGAAPGRGGTPHPPVADAGARQRSLVRALDPSAAG